MLRAAPGSAFTTRDWLLLASVALMWGSSFLLIKIGLQDFPPVTVAWLRIVFGALALALIPRARQPLRNPQDRGRVGLLGLTWMAVPFVLFTLAQQDIPSALAGMVNGAVPLFTTVFAILWFRRSPGTMVLAGLAVGFVGVILIGLPNIEGSASLTAVLLVLMASALYGVSFNITGPLQSRNGALSVIWRAQLVGLVVLAPFGIPGLFASTPTVGGVLALLALGALGTGLGFVWFSVLAGSVGAPRASVTTYLIPVVALILGVGLAGESIAPLSLAGVALVLVGAYLTARRTR